MVQRDYFNLPNVCAALLVLAFLVPQGLGYRFNFGQLDLQRFLLLLIVVLSCAIATKDVLLHGVVFLPLRSMTIILLAACFVISAVFSTNPRAGLVFASKFVLIWFVVPLSLVYLMQSVESSLVFRTCQVLLVGLLIYGTIEIATGANVIKPWMRTSFWGLDDYEWINARRILRNGSVLIQGPYMWNHGMAGALCVLCGIAFCWSEQRTLLGYVIAGLFVVCVVATGTRAAGVAIVIAMIVYLSVSRNWRLLLVVFFALTIYYLSFLKMFGAELPIAKTGDIHPQFMNFSVLSFEEYLQSANVLSSISFGYISSAGALEFLQSAGTLGERAAGLLLNLANWKSWVFSGYGLGSFQRPSIFASDAIQYNDPGLWFLILFETGLVPIVLIFWLLAFSVYRGLSQIETRGYAIGIIGAFVFGLSSWEIWAMPIVLFFALWILRKAYKREYEYD